MPSRDPFETAPAPLATPRANIPAPGLSPTTRGLALAAAVLLGAGFLFGLVRFVLADPIPTMVLPRRERPPAEEHNLCDFRYGPTLRVSSYHRDPINQHHPLFLIDGRTAPSLLEKWVSAGKDRAPWVEITWREPHDLSRVVIRHAGEYEGKELSLARYRLTCLRDGKPGPTLQIEDNRAGLALHALPCPGARGVRLQAFPPGRDIVRIYEIEAWGQ
jgi:hypothetical protein